jgi:hypothetical protein
MLYEITHQRDGRWFSDEYFDLFVWEAGRRIERFQLCYDLDRQERVVSWSEEGGYSHCKVDNGPGAGAYPATPILLADGVFDFTTVARRFSERSVEIDQEIAAFIYQALLAYGTLGPSKLQETGGAIGD